jgi:hypothetical protein
MSQRCHERPHASQQKEALVNAIIIALGRSIQQQHAKRNNPSGQASM